MPIEIRELVIKATVRKGTDDENKRGFSRDHYGNLKREIIEECMEKLRAVMEGQHLR